MSEKRVRHNYSARIVLFDSLKHFCAIHVLEGGEGSNMVADKSYRLRVIVGMLLEERGISADSVTDAEIVKAELLADAFLKKIEVEKDENCSISMLHKPS